MKPPSQSAASFSRQRLVRLMQAVNFGRILGLTVRSGEPIMEPAPKVIRTVKLAGPNGPRPEHDRIDFELKRELIELFQHLDVIGDGIIACIEIRHGLPHVMEIEQ